MPTANISVKAKQLIKIINVKIMFNVRPVFFYTKPFVYKSVAICLIMIKLLQDTV